MAAPRRSSPGLTAPKLAAARKPTGQGPAATPPTPEDPGRSPAQGKTQVWIPGALLPGAEAGAPALAASEPVAARPPVDAAPGGGAATGNTLRGAFGGAVAAAFAETFGDTPPHAGAQAVDGAPSGGAHGPDMNTVVEVGPPAALRAEGSREPVAAQPAPVRGKKTQIWLGGGLPPSANARPAARAGEAPEADGPRPSPGAFVTDVAFPEPASAQPGVGGAPMKTTVGFPPPGQSLAAAAAEARAAADAARAEEAGPAPAPAPPQASAGPARASGQGAPPGPPTPAPAASPPRPASHKSASDFQRAAEQGFTRHGREAPPGGRSVWVWVAGGVAVLAAALALLLLR